ncbi:uncharacterized protein YqhG [Melghirimyces profundicolus]|uniref:Uncharacterized protein YqhG n=1 Tax=Melghirimyces profundicolus TaxID=1242148 RepID=A0A2T6BG29_9BACL|nr:YqhG family protein [Melghirimyces profundicolus]PTX55001.1 uncharacterized protein YqhG [Melghirimyces profundicolus]
MEPSQVKSFAERYLDAFGCRIIEQRPGLIQAELSVEADPDLVHRPFYWMYVEKMGLNPQTSTLTWVFDREEAPQGIPAERLSFGSPRFQQMLHSARKHGRFIRLYEDTPRPVRSRAGSKPYDPWLGVNYRISYLCDRKKEEILHFGIHLRTGEIIENFYSRIRDRNWNPRLPAHRHILPPLFTVAEAVGELEYNLQGYVEQQDMEWARDAKEQLNRELERLHAYYPEEWRMSDELHEEKKQRIRETVWQYHPRVEVEVVNAGLFYLDTPPV